MVGDVLKMLDDRKLRENTVVMFFGDHGWGMSRGKRWCYDSGTRAPLLVRWPGQLKPGSVREDLVAFLDLAPTVLSLAGVEVPKRMQGQIFLGDKRATPREYVYSARDRMDEAFDRIRTVRSDNYVHYLPLSSNVCSFDRIRTVRSDNYRYIRNFHPEIPYAQWINYMDEMPTMKVWRKLAFSGKLNDVQMAFFAKTKPAEELYDIRTDPHETNNLIGAESALIQAIARDHRAALERWMKDTCDLGAVPEKELIRRGLVKDLLTTEYEARIKLHPKTSPVPE